VSSDDFDDRAVETAALREAIRARDEFISFAAHELKTPLSAMQLHVQMLLRSAQREGLAAIDPAKAVARLEAIGRQVGRLNDIIEHLLDVSRISRGRFDLAYASADLVEMAREAVAAAGGHVAQEGNAIEVRAEESVVGQWDRQRVLQILAILLSNAVKYGGGHPIEVSVARLGDRALVAVSDKGIGIAAADHARIFGCFERVEGAQPADSFGVGLWIADQIVQAMAGRIRLTSEPGKGARFEVDLPLAPPPRG
jgi:signal transduction histidine kinase